MIGKTSGGQTASATLDVLKELSVIAFEQSYYNKGDGCSQTNYDTYNVTQNFKYDDEDNHAQDVNFCEYDAYNDDNDEGDSKYIYFGFGYLNENVQGTVGTVKGTVEYTITDGFKTYLSSNNEYKDILTYYNSYTETLASHSDYGSPQYSWLDEYAIDQVPCFCDLTYECSKPNKDTNKIKLVYQLKTALQNYIYTNNGDGGHAIQANIKITNTYNSQTYTLANGTFTFSPSIYYNFATTGISISSSSGVFTQA